VTAADPAAELDAIVVAPMSVDDLDGVLAIERRVYPRPWSAKLFEDELGRRGRCYLAARSATSVVGYAGLLMIADDGHVATVAVDPALQGRRIATRLLLALVRSALDLGAHQLTLEVRASNRRAQALYGRFGFAPAGARKGYYGDNGEDAVVMWAHDVGGDDYAERLRRIEADLSTPTVHRGPAANRAASAVVDHPAVARSGSRAGRGRMVP